MFAFKTLLVAAVLTCSTPAFAQDYDRCGTLTDNFGSGCTTLLDDQGEQWLVNGSLGTHVIGDTVRVVGTMNTGCINFCFSLSGCIDNPVIFDTCSAPAPDYDRCGVLTDNFGSGCTTLLDDQGEQWLINGPLGTHVIGDTIRVQGTMNTACVNFCFVLAGCVDNPVIFDSCEPGTPSCNGDGGDQMGCTDCPCTNEAPQGTEGGCINSANQSAALDVSGDTSLSGGSLRVEMTGGNFSTFGVLVSADNLLPQMGPCPAGSGIVGIAALDGLRCVGGNLLRHGSRATDSNGDIGTTNNAWGPPNGPTGGIGMDAGFVSGQTRSFQVFYREEATLVCQSGQNTSNAYTVTFTP